MVLLFSRSDVREIKAQDQTSAMNKGSLKDLITKLSAETLEALAKRFNATTHSDKVLCQICLWRQDIRQRTTILRN
ncbi:hypothetical protein M378DRAFT_169337 [Amanita muscaria Koide BX008]|uniref:Uncharacterized protein n=1 Tax=Amanita muscaria (strain Koide BX008) TaxID=946122 RepID=A0A0C2WRN4_AMAMK|nr:hypothetical protein M378DRAFT_169337 [Amanita muscaria Koide BX008]